MRARGPVVVALQPAGPGWDRAVAGELRESLARLLGYEGLSLAVGGRARGQNAARASLLQARHALVVGRVLAGEGKVTFFEDLGPYCFVLGRPESEIRGFCERILGPLAERGPHDELVRTLEEFFRQHGSVSAVARTLYLHRNTVRQRLRRIERLTGADLDDADARLALRLAILGRTALVELAS